MRCNRSWPTTWYPWSTGRYSWSVWIVTLSWRRCRVHLRRWWGGKDERLLSRAVGSLCESWGRGRVWDRSGSRYRLWWFVHFTFLCGSALGWPSLASLSLKKQKLLIVALFCVNPGTTSETVISFLRKKSFFQTKSNAL